MSQILIALSVWLHALGTVVLIGHYLLLSVIYLPVLQRTTERLLSEISKRSRPWMYASLLIFMVTGIYLMFADPNYLGFGNFGNVWGVHDAGQAFPRSGDDRAGVLVQCHPAGRTDDGLE